MAKQGGPFIFEKTYGNVICYRVGDMGLIRTKGSLTRERWETEKAFEKSRICAGYMKKISPMASVLYNKLPKSIRKVIYFRQLTGLGNQLMNAGFSLEQARKVMEQAYINLRRNLKKAGKNSRRKNSPVRKKHLPELYTPTAPTGLYKHLPKQPNSTRCTSRRIKRRSACRPSTPQRPAIQTTVMYHSGISNRC